MTQDPAQATTLCWGVKQSFRRYVETVGGAIEADGVGRAPQGEFVFTAAPEASDLTLDADGKPQGQARFPGEVRFAAHGGMLSVRLAELALEIAPSRAVLTVADGPGRRIEIARLDLDAITPGEPGELVIPAALTLDGCQFLGDHYPQNTPLDPVRLTLAGR